MKAHLHRSIRDSHNNHNDAVSDAANNHNNAPVDIREAALEGVRGGLVPGAPQAGVVAEPLPRKLTYVNTRETIWFLESTNYFSPPPERVFGEETMRQHARPGQLVQQVREVEQLQVQRRQMGPGQES